MDHMYSFKTPKPKDRMASMFGGNVEASSEHGYSTPMTHSTPMTPTKQKRPEKRSRSSPTGKTPKQPEKILMKDHKTNTPWTPAEKEFVTKYIESVPQGEDILMVYWTKCAEKVNVQFPSHSRNGIACKSLAQRLLISPSRKNQEINAGAPLTKEAGTQTDLILPSYASGDTRREGDWLHIEPNKDIQPDASIGAHTLHATARRRFRKYPELTNTEKAQYVDLLSTCSTVQCARTILTSTLGRVIKTLLINDVELEACDASTRGSVLCKKNFSDLKNFKWHNVVTEMSEKQPLLLEVLLAAALPSRKVGHESYTEAVTPVIGTVYGMLMKQRFPEMSVVQRLVSVSLANEQVHQKVYDQLQRIGVAMSHSSVLDFMSAISGSFNSELIDSVKCGKKFRLIGDNVNFHVGVAQVRQQIGKVDHMEHWFGSAAIIQNVNFSYLPDISPQQDIRQLPCDQFILSETELTEIVKDVSLLFGKILVEHFPWLKFAKNAVTKHTFDMPDGMADKNKVIPLPILHKNEQKYADVVDILDSYQELCEQTFESAQKPLHRVHIGGDQLTRDRFSGAKSLRAAALTSSERLESLNPVTFELFHLQMTVLSAFYHILYDTQVTEPFSLYSQKVILLRKDADGNDVKNHYDSCKDLAESFIKAFVVEAFCEHVGLPNTDVVPDNIPDYVNMSSDEIRSWLAEQISPIVNSVLTVTRNSLSGIQTLQNDTINSYGKIVVEIGLIYLHLNDIVKHPNRERLLRVMKYLMLMLKGHNNRSKYALEILRLLSQQYALLSEQCAHEAIYGMFVNTGKSIIPADLQMEYLVKVTKGHLRSMCSNVTDASLKKRSSSFYGIKEIAGHFDNETSTVTRANKHKKLSAVEDEKKIIACLRTIRPFLEVPGRKVTSMKKSPKNPISKIVLDDIMQWIEYHKLNLHYQV